MPILPLLDDRLKCTNSRKSLDFFICIVYNEPVLRKMQGIFARIKRMFLYEKDTYYML